jgi:hypothetical protein
MSGVNSARSPTEHLLLRRAITPARSKWLSRCEETLIPDRFVHRIQDAGPSGAIGVTFERAVASDRHEHADRRFGCDA